MKYNISKALKVAKKLGIKVERIKEGYIRPKEGYSTRGYWNGGKTIHINLDTATNYIILHEIGHVINGYMCCTEHCEYAAHGTAMALARVFNIKLGPYDKQKVNVYAGWSEYCPAKKRNKK